jgi:polysaccharide pyruvyl transferase WcaK-like protein
MTTSTSMASSRSKVFVTLTGDYPNIGDALIRRRSLAWARLCGDSVAAFVGRAPDMWCQQINLSDEDDIYRQADIRSWFVAMLKAPRGFTLVLEPGEVDLRLNQYKWETMVLLFSLMTRIKGGRVIRPPRSLSRASPILTFWHKLGLRCSEVVLWREADSQALVDTGEVVPDIAFSEMPYGDESAPRPRLLISLRGLRPRPSAAWEESVQTFAQEQGLVITCIAQVRQDEVRAAELASALGGECIDFGDRDDLEQENLLRRAYAEAAVVISDRLHVLILASLGGCVPCELVPKPSSKVATHFRAAGIISITKDAEDSSVAEMLSFLHVVHGRRDELRRRVMAAHDQLKVIESEFVAVPTLSAQEDPNIVQG